MAWLDTFFCRLVRPERVEAFLATVLLLRGSALIFISRDWMAMATTRLEFDGEGCKSQPHISIAGRVKKKSRIPQEDGGSVSL